MDCVVYGLWLMHRRIGNDNVERIGDGDIWIGLVGIGKGTAESEMTSLLCSERWEEGRRHA